MKFGLAYFHILPAAPSVVEPKVPPQMIFPQNQPLSLFLPLIINCVSSYPGLSAARTFMVAPERREILTSPGIFTFFPFISATTGLPFEVDRATFCFVPFEVRAQPVKSIEAARKTLEKSAIFTMLLGFIDETPFCMDLKGKKKFYKKKKHLVNESKWGILVLFFKFF